MPLGWSGVRALESCFNLQPGHHSTLTAPNLEPTATQERDDQCGYQHNSNELLMMGIVVPETYLAYKKYSKIINGIQLVFSSIITMMHCPTHIKLNFFITLHLVCTYRSLECYS